VAVKDPLGHPGAVGDRPAGEPARPVASDNLLGGVEEQLPGIGEVDSSRQCGLLSG
jgi:hypothetical protein